MTPKRNDFFRNAAVRSGPLKQSGMEARSVTGLSGRVFPVYYEVRRTWRSSGDGLAEIFSRHRVLILRGITTTTKVSKQRATRVYAHNPRVCLSPSSILHCPPPSRYFLPTYGANSDTFDGCKNPLKLEDSEWPTDSDQPSAPAPLPQWMQVV